MAWHPAVGHGVDDLPSGRVFFRQRRIVALPHQIGALRRVELVAQLAAVFANVL